ncbi:hypothetical protein D3C81_1539690 [compost metagenome]
MNAVFDRSGYPAGTHGYTRCGGRCGAIGDGKSRLIRRKIRGVWPNNIRWREQHCALGKDGRQPQSQDNQGNDAKYLDCFHFSALDHSRNE